MCLILFLLNSGASLAHTCSLSALLMFLGTVLVQTSIHLIRPPPPGLKQVGSKVYGFLVCNTHMLSAQSA